LMGRFTTIWLRGELVDRMRPLKRELTPKYVPRREATWSDVIEFLLEKAGIAVEEAGVTASPPRTSAGMHRTAGV
jgi:hypothetical protein